MTFALLLPFFLVSLLVIESFILRRSRARIPLRILVNGTRGKSTVVRYIVAGLRAGGRRRIAGKVTGTFPTFFLPDGTNEILKRRGSARVQEQVRLIRRSGTMNCDALVLECMSITPELQRLESALLQPHIYVLTNIRDDHREILGKTQSEQLEAFVGALPTNTAIVTEEHESQIAAIVQRRNSTLKKLKERTDRNGDGFTQDNIRLALAACTEAGVAPQVALRGILEEVKHSIEPLVRWSVRNSEVRFINGFSVNDVSSTRKFFNDWDEKLGGWGTLWIILNTRADRPFRTEQLVRWAVDETELEGMILLGSHVGFARRALHKMGFSQQSIHHWSREQVRQPRQELEKLVRGTTTFLGIGNIAGDGCAFLKSIQSNRNLP